MITIRRGFALALCVAAPLGVAACGSSDDSSSGGGGASTGSSTSSGQTKSFKAGYSEATGQNPWMTTIGTSADKVIKAAGGSTEITDAQLDPAKAVQQITRFVTDGVNSITVAPAQVPNAVKGVLTKAHGQGIHVFGLEWSYADDPTAAPDAPLDGQVNINRAQVAKEVDEAINADNPNGAKVVYIGLPFPVVGVDFFEKNMKANLGKSKLVANIDNPKDNAQGALGPLNAALSAHPDTTAIVTYNGPSALAAVQAVKSAGLAGKTKVYDIQLDTGAAKAVKDGTIAAAWDLNPPKLGEALGQMIAAAGQGKPKSEWSKTVMVDAPKYTKDNIDTWTDWAKG
jgi:ABC-type sugar transport system substrate-binding protein